MSGLFSIVRCATNETTCTKCLYQFSVARKCVSSDPHYWPLRTYETYHFFLGCNHRNVIRPDLLTSFTVQHCEKQKTVPIIMWSTATHWHEKKWGAVGTKDNMSGALNYPEGLDGSRRSFSMPSICYLNLTRTIVQSGRLHRFYCYIFCS